MRPRLFEVLVALIPNGIRKRLIVQVTDSSWPRCLRPLAPWARGRRLGGLPAAYARRPTRGRRELMGRRPVPHH
jgi:hypothetical protein